MRKYYWLLCLLGFLNVTDALADSIRVRPCRPVNYQLSAHNSKSRRALPTFNYQLSTSNPYIGDRRQLVVLVSFSDQTFEQDDPLPMWNRIFNEEHYTEAPYYGSVHDYFYDQSYGQLRLTFDLCWIKLEESCAKYRSNDYDDENSQYLVDDIVTALTERDTDWSLYDWDGDSYVDQLLIVYAGLGMNDGGGSNTIWPHQWWMTEHQDSDGNKREALTVYHDGKPYKIDCYCCVQERPKKTDSSTFGTLCHEYSHCFGLPDFYDYSKSYVYSWDLMDYGNYTGNGFHPVGYSAHERMLMGWLTPVELTEPAIITDMPSTSTHPVCYIIRNDANTDEYYMVENRQQTSWDTGLPGSGIVVFHVVFDSHEWKFGSVNNASIQRYTIFPANNKTNTKYESGWAYPYEQNDSLTNYSAPASTLYYANTDSTKLMSKPLRAMNVKDGLASFCFMDADPSSHVEELSTLNPQLSTLYDLTGRPVTPRVERGTRPLPRGIYISEGKKILVK